MERKPLYRHESLCMNLTMGSAVLLLAAVIAMLFSSVDVSRLLIVALFAIYGIRDTLWMQHKYGIPIGLLQLTGAAFLLLTISIVFPNVPNNMDHVFWSVFAVCISTAIFLRGLIHRERANEN